MTKEQTKRPYVTFAITSTLLTLFILFILFINNNQFQILSAQNNDSTTNNNNSTISKGATAAKNPSSVNSTDNGVSAMRPTPALTQSNPSNVIESFMSPKALLASTIDQIRNSTVRNDNSSIGTS